MEVLHRERLRAGGALWRRRARAAGRNGRAIVLYYHRIAAPRLDPWRTSVSPATFATHLEMLAAEMRVLPLAELVAARRRGTIPERAVAITFDDGYVDNLEQGLPLLERHRLPAVFYIPTGLIGTPGPLWWDEIADLMLGSGPRPAELDVDLGGTRIRLPTRTDEERRHALYGDVNGALKRLAPQQIDAALVPLRAWADRDPGAEPVSADGVSEPRPMTVPELERLGSHELVEIGAHTALHPSLPKLPLEQRRAEIESSREMLAGLGMEPRSFAYPFGDNDAATRRLVAEAGFESAVGVQEHMPLTTAARELEIPRMMPLEESAEELRRRIAGVLALAGGG